MNWVAVCAAILGILNAIFSFWRWRADRTYIAFSVQITNLDAAADDCEGYPTVELANSGSATAYNVFLAYFVRGEEFANALGSGIPYLRPADPPVIFELRYHEEQRIEEWKIQYEDRPGSKNSREEVWDVGMNRRTDRLNVRQRIGRRIAGDR